MHYTGRDERNLSVPYAKMTPNEDKLSNKLSNKDWSKFQYFVDALIDSACIDKPLDTVSSFYLSPRPDASKVSELFAKSVESLAGAFERHVGTPFDKRRQLVEQDLSLEAKSSPAARTALAGLRAAWEGTSRLGQAGVPDLSRPGPSLADALPDLKDL